MKSKIYLAAVALAGVAMFCGCTKDGPTGPQGPQGNANVLGSNALAIDWAYNSGSNKFTDTISSPDITQDIVNTGSVEGFVQYGNEWWVLPDINGVEITTYGYGIDNGVGYVSLESTTTDNSIPSPPSTIRIVIISSAARMAHPNVNWNNYEETKAALNLRD